MFYRSCLLLWLVLLPGLAFASGGSMGPLAGLIVIFVGPFLFLPGLILSFVWKFRRNSTTLLLAKIGLGLNVAVFVWILYNWMELLPDMGEKLAFIFLFAGEVTLSAFFMRRSLDAPVAPSASEDHPATSD